MSSVNLQARVPSQLADQVERIRCDIERKTGVKVSTSSVLTMLVREGIHARLVTA